MTAFVRLVVILAVCRANTPASQASHVELKGIIEALTSGAEGDSTILLGGLRVSAGADVAVKLPGLQVTMKELLAQAPIECRERNESGLVRTDRCLGSRSEFRGTLAIVTGERDATGVIRATAIVLPGGQDAISGPVTYVSPTDGYLRIRGEYGADRGGTVLRINDPTGAQSVQQGSGCGREGNCSPDARFRIDTATPSVRFSTGNPACVPADAVADGFCPASARRAPLGAGLLPVQKGDHVSATGSYDVVGGVRLFVAHTLVADGADLAPRPPDPLSVPGA